VTTHALRLPGSDDIIVLTEYSLGDDPANLSRMRSDGSVVWRAPPPEPKDDFWTEAELDEHAVSAFSWSCYRVRLDVDTGLELTRTGLLHVRLTVVVIDHAA
jgi:hypothetical protein